MDHMIIKENLIYTYNGMYSAIKNKILLSAIAWLNLKDMLWRVVKSLKYKFHQSEVSKAVKFVRVERLIRRKSRRKRGIAIK